MSRKFEMNGIKIASPTVLKPIFATTSTEDSERAQTGVMYNTPMFTVDGFDLSWEMLTSAEISAILQQAINKSSFSFYCPHPLTGQWERKQYYASNYSGALLSTVNGVERWENLSFNIRGIKPV